MPPVPKVEMVVKKSDNNVDIYPEDVKALMHPQWEKIVEGTGDCLSCDR
jgi:hypothetical protein